MADEARRQTRWHGRVEANGRACDHPGCEGEGEFRAPPADGRRPGFDGPGEWRWLCLEHVRAFNAGYNFFSGMSSEEIEAQQRPYAGWERETRAFSATPGGTPRWADFTDPLDAISGRFAQARPAERKDGRRVNEGERKALKTLGLDLDADRRQLRTRYTELVRRYHPDHNGGDRSHETALQEVIAAYQLLKGSSVFA